MKRKLLLLAFCFGALGAFGQISQKIKSTVSLQSDMKFNNNNHFNNGFYPKSFGCRDTIRYTEAKEILLGSSAYRGLILEKAYNDEISQAFLLSGSSLEITGVNIWAANSRNGGEGTPSVTVQISVYNVDANNVPTTLIQSVNTTLTSTTFARYNVNFPTAVNVTGNYAITIKPISANSRVDIVCSKLNGDPALFENLAKIKSNYSTSSGQFVDPTIATMIFFNESYNLEPMIAPIVSYPITATATINPIESCVGTPVDFAGTASPASILSNRMYNYKIFRTHFNLAPADSTFLWDMDNNTQIWNANHTYTYATPGTYEAVFVVYGGFWYGCVDYLSQEIIIKSLPTVTASASETNICNGEPTTLSASGATTYAWEDGDGNAVTNLTVSPSATTTYTVTVNNGTCSVSEDVTITVTPLDDATFSYGANSFCIGSPNITPTTVDVGTFSSTPTGLLIDAATGVIAVATSMTGSYTITKTTAGACPDVKTQVVTISDDFDASFTYNQTEYCKSEINPTPTFPTGANAGTFTASPAGLVIDATTGVVNLATSTAGTYIVTNTIAATGTCATATETFEVTVHEAVTATVHGGGEVCEGTGTVSVFITFTGTGPWDFTYSDGTASTPETGQTTSLFTINAGNNATYTVTTASNGTCSTVGTGSAPVIFHPNPVINFTSVTAMCESDAAVTLTAIPAGGIFSGTGVTGTSFDPAVASVGTHTITYEYEDANGCAASAQNDVVVNANPTVSLTVVTDLCINSGAITLTGGLPVGGTYSINNATVTNFDPATAGIGTHTVTYNYTNTDGCSGSATTNIVVDACAGVEDIFALNVGVYPNPAENKLFITLEGAQTATFSLITAEGKVIIENQVISNGMNTIDVSDCAKGLYLIHFNSEAGNSVQRLMLK